MQMMLPDGTLIERPAFYDKPQYEWTAEEVKQAVEFQEMHLKLQRVADQEGRDATSNG